ncbi:chemokine (C-C motif) ligand 22 [Rattus norvegicus]|uniref:Chemokine (C-C motif) ligand 22 n=1 Tax=Rattus norvegicus TaxID=10116 RepID=A6JY49_RAT|nr:chemokine (C-C motif) ligand 22 [Rattus norvegicus]
MTTGLVSPQGSANPILLPSSKSLANNSTFAHLHPLGCHSVKPQVPVLPVRPLQLILFQRGSREALLASLTQYLLPTALDETRVLVLVPLDPMMPWPPSLLTCREHQYLSSMCYPVPLPRRLLGPGILSLLQALSSTTHLPGFHPSQSQAPCFRLPWPPPTLRILGVSDWSTRPQGRRSPQELLLFLGLQHRSGLRIRFLKGAANSTSKINLPPSLM